MLLAMLVQLKDQLRVKSIFMQFLKTTSVLYAVLLTNFLDMLMILVVFSFTLFTQG